MAKRFLVKYGGHLSRIAKREEEWIETDSEMTIDEVLKKISEKYRGLSGSGIPNSRISYLITINGEFFPTSSLEGLLIRDGDVVGLFPPVSGG